MTDDVYHVAPQLHIDRDKEPNNSLKTIKSNFIENSKADN